MTESGQFPYVWILVAAGVVVLLLTVLLVWCCCRLRHYRRYDYTALRDDLELPAKMELERRIQQDQLRDAALMNCQYYLRSAGRYTLINQFADIGSRFNKHWFLVRDRRDKQEKLLTITPRSDQMLLSFNSSTKEILNEMFLLMRHPYLYPKSDIDFSTDQNLVVSTEPFNPKGSLKDLIYSCKCTDVWEVKYRKKSQGLPLKDIQLFGRQILEGLMFLEEKGFPLHGHLHSGNIIIQENVARITGCENSFFGLPSKVWTSMRRKLKDDKNAMDVVCFGHILFEMAAGYELDSTHPEPKHLVSVSHSPVIHVLNFIFENEDIGFYPTIKQLAEHELFKYVTLKELKVYNPAPINFSSQMKYLLRGVRKGKAVRATKSGKIKSSRKSSVSAADETSSTRSSKTRSSSTMSSNAREAGPSTTVPPPPPSIVPPPPPPAPSSGPPVQPSGSSRERGALLGQIRAGTRLKRAETNDRSAPKV